MLEVVAIGLLEGCGFGLICLRIWMSVACGGNLSAPALAPLRAHKARDAEISEESKHSRRSKQAAVLCGMRERGAPLMAQTPDGNAGRECKDAEEHASEFQPEH